MTFLIALMININNKFLDKFVIASSYLGDCLQLTSLLNQIHDLLAPKSINMELSLTSNHALVDMFPKRGENLIYEKSSAASKGERECYQRRNRRKSNDIVEERRPQKWCSAMIDNNT